MFLVLLLVLGAEFLNGLTDAANSIATVVGTRVLSPMKAVIMAAVLNMAGVLITGTAVATTIGTGIVSPDVITLEVLGAAMLTIMVWTTIAWYFGIPTSETHELSSDLDNADYVVRIEMSGYQAKTVKARTAKDTYIGEIVLKK